MATINDRLDDIIESDFAGTTPNLLQERYKFNYMVFPNDLGMDDNGHYMIININVPTAGFKTNGNAVNEVAGAFKSFVDPLNEVSKLDRLRYGENVLGGEQRPFLSIPRQTRRIAESIVLHMPQGLIYRHDNAYENIELTSLAGKVGVGALSAINKGLGTVAGTIAGATSAGLKLMQAPINPAVEILFANTLQRQFTFDMLLAPRNEEESYSIQKIYTTLKFHGAPEINPVTYGATWIPPADFDITFFHRGVENTSIPRINTCVLETLVLDPMPQGMYATFRNGYPVAFRLGLGFRELEPVHKQRVLQGF